MGDEADLAEFIGTGGPGAGKVPITAWRWKLVPQPAPGPLTPRGQAWEMTRHQAYLARLAGRAVGETFGCTAEFLTMAAASPVTGDESVRAAVLGVLPRQVNSPENKDAQRTGA
jgi:hypothetical protein